MGTDRIKCVREIRRVVGAKAKLSPDCRSSGQGIQKRGLNQSVFPVSALGPGIREEHEDAGQQTITGQGLDQKPGLCLHPSNIRAAGPGSFTLGPLEAIRNQINAHAKLIWMRLGIGSQKMAVPTADFQG